MERFSKGAVYSLYLASLLIVSLYFIVYTWMVYTSDSSSLHSCLLYWFILHTPPHHIVHLEEEIGDIDHMVGQEAKSGNCLQLHWIPRQFRQSGPFFRHSGSRQQLLIYLEARFSPDLVCHFWRLAPFSYLSAGHGGSVMKDILPGKVRLTNRTQSL